MNVRALVPILVMSLSACVSLPPPASDAEKTAAATDYLNCLRGMAEKLDDGISDATAIALGIEPGCAREFAHSIEVNGRGMNAATFALFRQKEQRDQIQIATALVLRVRSLRASSN